MKEPLMPAGEIAAYIVMLVISVFSIWATFRIYHTDSLLWRTFSLIPAGLITAVWIAMTIGVLSALKYRSPEDE
jgi:hypothetical protein